MRTAEEKITRGKLLSVAIAKVMYCDQEGEHSKDELIVALCEKYLDEAVAHGMTLSAEIARNKVVECPKFDTPNLCDSCKTLMVFADDLLTARDNKVWRNGGKMSD